MAKRRDKRRKKLSAYNYQDLESKLKGVSHELDLLDPVTLLLGTANGCDLSSRSTVYEKALDIEEQLKNGQVDEFAIMELISDVKAHNRWRPVSDQQQTAAQKQLSEFLHGKKKNIDIDAKVSTVSQDVKPLSKREIRNFRKAFNKDY
jgi:hypothetical protein